jgi:hypothetical protein
VEIRYELSAPATTLVRIFDLRGRLLWKSPPVAQQAGPQSCAWHGRDGRGQSQPTGVYLYTLELDGRVHARGKFTLVK